MTNRRALSATVALLLLVLVVWHVRRSAPRIAPAASPSSAAPARPASAVPRPAEVAERSPLADTLNSPATDIRADLRLVSDLIDAFRSNFPQAGNPVGANDEITAALTGKNKLHLALLPRDHPAINAAGELCDRWGTPFFFHAESARKMTLRSAGPDKKMWTADDVEFTP